MVVGAQTRSDGHHHGVEKIINHPCEKDVEIKRKRDISLIKTKKEIRFNEHVQLIELNLDWIGANVEVVVSGWGRENKTVRFAKHSFRISVLNEIFEYFSKRQAKICR